jgi:hypothetical protein
MSARRSPKSISGVPVDMDVALAAREGFQALPLLGWWNDTHPAAARS